jgi:hypothetical protein
MIPQLELDGVGIQIDLLFKIRLIVFPDIMVDKGKGHN